MGCVQDDLIFVREPRKTACSADEKEADGDAGEGEGVGEKHCLPVHDDQADEEEAEDGDGQLAIR